MAIKSALMTTGADVLDTFVDTAAADPSALKRGSRRAPGRSAAAGGRPRPRLRQRRLRLVRVPLRATNQVPASTCSFLTGLGYSTDRSDMNLASIAIGDLIAARRR